MTHFHVVDRNKALDRRECFDEVKETLVAVDTGSARSTGGRIITKIQGSTGIGDPLGVVVGQDLISSRSDKSGSVRVGVGIETIPPIVIGRAGRVVNRSVRAHPAKAVGVSDPVNDRRPECRSSHFAVPLHGLCSKRVTCNNDLIEVREKSLVVIVSSQLVQGCKRGDGVLP